MMKALKIMFMILRTLKHVSIRRELLGSHGQGHSADLVSGMGCIMLAHPTSWH